jgi:sec-independent protein translocase protein TatA
MLSNLRGWEWLILLLIVLLLFGARRLPELARSVGRSAKIFRSEVKDLRDDDARVDRNATESPTSGAGTAPVTASSAAAPPAAAAPATASAAHARTSDAVASPAGVSADDERERHRA